MEGRRSEHEIPNRMSKYDMSIRNDFAILTIRQVFLTRILACVWKIYSLKI